MKPHLIVAVCAPSAAAAIALAATAHADPAYQVQSPSGNFACSMYTHDDGTGSATCEVAGDTAGPPLPCPSPPASHRHFELDQGHAADVGCGYTLFVPGLPTLDYGQTRSAGAIACVSELSGMRCTDSSTGHCFRVSAQAYELG
jgi:hypothetical protein